MTRGRPKKTAVEPELLPAEDSQPSQKVIKHKTEWVEVVEDAPESDSVDFEDAEIEDKPRKKNKNAIQEMRKKLRAQGVTPTSNLRLYIERYVHSETDAGGSWAETEFCTKYSTTEEHIFNKDYIDAARKWGPGKYRITIRMDNRIVDAFDERISATPSGPIIQHVNPNDPTSPQVIVQMPEGAGQQQAQPMSFADMAKFQDQLFERRLKEIKLFRETFGLSSDRPQEQPPIDPEIAALQLITKNPDVMEKIAGGIAKTIFGGKGVADDTPWWASSLEKAITTGQLAPTVQGIVKALLPNGLFGGLFSGGQQNGQAQMATPPVQNQTPEGSNQQQRSDLVSSPQGSLEQGAGQVGSPQALAGGTSGDVAGAVLGGNESQVAITPEEAALRTLIDNCVRKVPPQIAFDRLMAYAEAVNEQYPQGSIDGYIDMLGSAPIDAVIDYVKSLPGGEQIVNLPHAKDWCAELQKLIKESQEGEE